MNNCTDFEDLNKWSSFEIYTSLEIIELASKHGVKDFYFFIDPAEKGKEFEIVETSQLHNEIENQLVHKNLKLRYTNGNSLIARTCDLETAADILNLKEIFQLKVKVKLVTENLFTSFVIREVGKDIHVGNFINTLRIEGDIPVISARRFFRKGKPTKTIQINIPGQVIPKEVRVDKLIIKVESYIEKPKQCYCCYQFGHIKNKCRIKAICGKCGIELIKVDENKKEEIHDAENCKGSNCRNCKGNHKADDPSCPEYSKNVKLIEIRKRLQVPFFEAKRIYYKENKRSYANSVTLKQESNLSSCDYIEKVTVLKKEVQKSLQEFKISQEKELTTFKEEIRNEIKKHDELIKEKLSQCISRNELYHIIENMNSKIDGTIKAMNEQFIAIDRKLNQIILSQQPKSKEQQNLLLKEASTPIRKKFAENKHPTSNQNNYNQQHKQIEDRKPPVKKNYQKEIDSSNFTIHETQKMDFDTVIENSYLNLKMHCDNLNQTFARDFKQTTENIAETIAKAIRTSGCLESCSE